MRNNTWFNKKLLITLRENCYIAYVDRYDDKHACYQGDKEHRLKGCRVRMYKTKLHYQVDSKKYFYNNDEIQKYLKQVG